MKTTQELMERLGPLTSGLLYISETDAAVEPFCAGQASGDIRADIIRYLGSEGGVRVQTMSPAGFFGKLAAKHEWHTPSQSERAERFKTLGEFIQEELENSLVIRVGEVRVQIVVAGTDREGKVCGVKTFAVET